MQRLPSRGQAARPRPMPASRSFARYESSSPGPVSTSTGEDPLQHGDKDEDEQVEDSSSFPAVADSHDDVFDRRDDDDPVPVAAPDVPAQSADHFDELPIEIQSLTERFLESLSLKSHPSPLSIDQLSELYQNFYAHAESQIAIHIASLASRLSRDKSPAASISSTSSVASRGPRRGARHQDKLSARDADSEQQMLTASEVSDRRKARRQLDIKRLLLEEAVERSVCEKVYPRLWRHRTTDDDERDEKLRSRAAALSVVGIGLRELLSTALATADEEAKQDVPSSAAEHDSAVRSQLSEARNSLERMNQDRYPLGKLQHLTAAHKSIVDTLSHIFPSTSSADEVLPTLIYTIITSAPETIHVVSNFNFIQRFRASSKLDGEAAYCLTNLEAAVSFLETVDLSSIRSTETPEGPQRPGNVSASPRKEVADPLYRGLPASSPELRGEGEDVPVAAPTTATSSHARRLSSLFNARPRSLDGAGGAVLNGADTAIDTIHGALDTSFKFLFGRIREKQATQSPIEGSGIAQPKTLEDARQLVSSPTLLEEDEAEQADALGHGLGVERSEGHDRVLKLVGGRRAMRERSVDSSRSTGSGRRVAFASSATAGASAEGSPSGNVGGTTLPMTAAAAQTASYAAVESMRNLGNTFNPLKGFSMRGFGRASPLEPVADSSPAGSAAGLMGPAAPSSQGEGTMEKNGIDLSGIGAPIQRFVELKDFRELNYFDTEQLLRDYQRLAGALNAARTGEGA